VELDCNQIRDPLKITICYTWSLGVKMSDQEWRVLTNYELEIARASRQSGNEGRTRVCARRAAGHIAGEFINRRGLDFTLESALERLRYLYSSEETNEEAKSTINRFLVHVTPEHKLPMEADLVEDVHLLARQLLGEELS
jgi:hypothetical protein